MRRRAALIRIAAVAAAAAAVLLAVIAITRFEQRRRENDPVIHASDLDKNRPELEDETITADGVAYRRNKDVETYLLLGIDRGGTKKGAGPGQADLLVLLAVDRGSRSFRVLPINRDTVTTYTVIDDEGNGIISGEMWGQICLSHAYGTGGQDSCENTVRSVEYLLPGSHVDGYVAFNLDDIGPLTDAVGGVPVTITEDLTALDPAFRKGETVLIDGGNVEKYVRARMDLGEEDNERRMSRQTAFMKAWAEKAGNLGGRGLTELLNDTLDLCVTDMTEKRLTALAEDMLDYENRGVLRIEGENVMKDYNEFRPDEDSLLQIILELFYTPITKQD